MSDFARTVKTNIRRMLEEQSVTIGELSRRTGIARPAISAMLNGEREIQTDTIQKIADAMGVKVAELVLEHETAAS